MEGGADGQERRLGEDNIHYVQDGIGKYAIPCAESLIANLVSQYFDEGGIMATLLAMNLCPIRELAMTRRGVYRYVLAHHHTIVSARYRYLVHSTVEQKLPSS